eukprot:PLAT11314.1.p1 GENE.PLAT11314.1~~PLAT11314.1.p1  ORF type:complete len:1096 (+),score=456.19 PLAT11314.1:51-3338(+)
MKTAFLLFCLIAIMGGASARLSLDDVRHAFSIAAYCKIEVAENYAVNTFGDSVVGENVWRFAPMYRNRAECEGRYHIEGLPTADGVWEEVFADEFQFTSAVAAAQEAITSAGRGVYIAKVPHVNTELESAWTAATGARFGNYMATPSGAFDIVFVYATPEQAASVAELEDVEDIVALPLELKMSPDLRMAIEAGREASLHIDLAPKCSSSMEESQALVARWNEELATPDAVLFLSGYDAVHVKLADSSTATALSVVGFLAAQPEALYLHLLHTNRVHNKYARFTTWDGSAAAGAGVTQNPVHAAGITGQGQVVGVADSGLDYNSCFFIDTQNPVQVQRRQTFTSRNARKVIYYNAYADAVAGEAQDHGTHVAGSVSGDATGQPGAPAAATVYGGMAYNAKIAFYDIGVAGQPSLQVPNQIENAIFQPAKQMGAHLHTNSWGANANAYSPNARSVDIFTFANQDFMVLVAAGNSGNQGPGSLGTPATAKNCISVGAASSSDPANAEAQFQCQEPQPCQNNMALFSSIGPAYDNRYGIDVVAPGFFILSAGSSANPTQATCQVVKMAGTSMATPVTAGNAALIRDYFESGFYPTGAKVAGNAFEPMGALVKAMLVAAAEPLTGNYRQQPMGPTPSPVQGFGEPRLKNSLRFAASDYNLFVEGDVANMQSLATGQTYEKTLAVQAGKPLTVVLAWNDAPGAAQANAGLVNDLDLQVIPPGGGNPLPVNNAQGPDTRNNIERVIVAQPTAGTYTVRVRGTAVRQGPQPFSLVATGVMPAAATPPTGGGGGGGDGAGAGSQDPLPPSPEETPEPSPALPPTIIATPDRNVRSGAKVIQITGTSFSPTTTNNVVTFSCVGDAAQLESPTGTVSLSTLTTIEVTVTNNWNCPANALLLARVVRSGEGPDQTSENVEVGKVVANDAAFSAAELQQACGAFNEPVSCGRSSGADGSGCYFDEAQRRCLPSQGNAATVVVVIVVVAIVIAIAIVVSRRSGSTTRYAMRPAAGPGPAAGGVAMTSRPASMAGGSPWRQSMDPKTGAAYWFNSATGESSWTNPLAGGGGMMSVGGGAAGWSPATDPATGATYWVNDATGESRWERPM